MNIVRRTQSEHIKAAARALGFDAVGIAEAGPADPDEHFLHWLEAGYSAGMTYMARAVDERRDPRRYVVGARSVVVVAASYYAPDAEPAPPLKVSRYCQGDDYHRWMKKKLRRLRRDLLELAPDADAAPVVDTSPVLERYWAHRAGVAWTGKSTMAVSTTLGTYTFLGCVITTLDLEPDRAHPDRCGSCSRCLHACPTGAFVGPRRLDARRCITYWNVEHRAPLPPSAPDLHGWVAGCDVCQQVCPWNKFARPPATANARARPRPELLRPDVDLWTDPGPDAERRLEAIIQGTALQRTGAAHLRRNARRIVEQARPQH